MTKDDPVKRIQIAVGAPDEPCKVYYDGHEMTWDSRLAAWVRVSDAPSVQNQTNVSERIGPKG